MPSLSTTRNYTSNNVLTKAMLDAAFDSIETFTNTTKLDSSNIQAGGIATSNLADASVTADKLAATVAGDGLTGGAGTALAVNPDGTTLEINADAVRIKDLGVSTAKIAAAAVTAAKLADASVNTNNLIDGSVTPVKRSAAVAASTGNCGVYSTTSGTFSGITNLSLSFTTTGGRPVVIMLIAEPSTSSIASIHGEGTIQITVDGAAYAQWNIAALGGYGNPYVTYLSNPAAGSSTIAVRGRADNSSTLYMNYIRLFVYEL